MSDGIRRELVYLSSYATNCYFIPNWGIHLELCIAKAKLCGYYHLDPLFRNRIYQPNRFVFRIKCVFVLPACVT